MIQCYDTICKFKSGSLLKFKPTIISNRGPNTKCYSKNSTQTYIFLSIKFFLNICLRELLLPNLTFLQKNSLILNFLFHFSFRCFKNPSFLTNTQHLNTTTKTVATSKSIPCTFHWVQPVGRHLAPTLLETSSSCGFKLALQHYYSALRAVRRPWALLRFKYWHYLKIPDSLELNSTF